MKYLFFLLLFPSLIFSQGGSDSFRCKYYSSDTPSEWTKVDYENSQCFSFLSGTFYVKQGPIKDKRYYKLEITNSSDVDVSVSIKWEHEKSGGRLDIPSKSSKTTEGLITDLRYISIEISRVRFSFNTAQREQYGSYETEYINCGGNYLMYLNNLEKNAKKNKIENLKVKIQNSGDTRSELETKLTYYDQLSQLDNNNYNTQIEETKNKIEEINTPKASKTPSSSRKTIKKEDEEDEDEEDEEEEVSMSYNQLLAQNTRKANTLYNQLQNNSFNLNERKKIISELNTYKGYLTPMQKQKLQQQKTENSITDTFVALNGIKLNDERVARRNLKAKYKNNSFSSYQFGAEFSNAWNFFYLSTYIHGIYGTIDGWELNDYKDRSNLEDGDLIYTTGDGDEEFLSRNENITFFGGGLELSMGIRADLSRKMALMPYAIGEIAIGSNNYSSFGFGAGLQLEIGKFTIGAEYITSTYNFRSGAGVSDILPPDIIPLTNDIEINENGVIQAEWLNSSTNQLSEVTYSTSSDREEQYNFTKPKLAYLTFSLAFSLN